MATRILTIDDSPSIRTIIRIYLINMGFEIVEAENAMKALELLKTQSVQLIICDINMPELDGLSFVKMIRADPRPAVAKVPVFMLTAEKSEDIQKRGKEAGANEFIPKPVTAKNLRDAVLKYLPQSAGPA